MTFIIRDLNNMISQEDKKGELFSRTSLLRVLIKLQLIQGLKTYN